MADVYIDVQAVVDAAKALANLKKQLQNQSNKVRQIENGVESAWQSKYTPEYIECVERTRKKIEEIASNVGWLSSNLYTIAAKADEMDKRLAAQIGGSGASGGNSGGGTR